MTHTTWSTQSPLKTPHASLHMQARNLLLSAAPQLTIIIVCTCRGNEHHSHQGNGQQAKSPRHLHEKGARDDRGR